MYWLLLLIFLLGPIWLLAQNPHGEGLELDCIVCHSTEGWSIDKSFWQFEDPEFSEKSSENDTTQQDTFFNHYLTELPLNGQHQHVD